ncbi:MAG TPA: M24 family metallopeptidase, partial [Verrucomicrobiae bacterium]|nr:M24 family metallopeptidase [Verrucomicrobiae bacterium]
GEPSEQQRKIYDTVLMAQQTSLAAIKPGLTGKEVDKIARDIITQAGFGDNFGHGLGHSLGLKVHEEPRLSPTGERALEPGMVVTVEPGIYLPGWGGVRIEDMVLVTDSGYKVLTKSPKELIIL